MEFLQDVLYAILIGVIPVLTTFIVKWLAKKAEELKLDIKTEVFDTTIDKVENMIRTAVATTTQTYVDGLKKEGMFTKEAQLEAFNKTKNAVLAQLTEDAKEVLAAVYGDINVYITNTIEAQVREQKF